MNNIGEIEQKSDAELVALSLAKQENYVYIIKRYEAQLKRYILRLSSFSREEAEDILQDVFIKVYQNLNSFDPRLKFSSWIYRIVHNEVITSFRRNKNKSKVISWDIDNKIIDKIQSDFDIKRRLDQESLAIQIRKIFKDMDYKYAQVLELKFLENKSYKEISDILQKPENTIATWISRAKKQFKEKIKQTNLEIN
ncbi:MAG: RNA polymerase sigma factor [Candidatus Parcubacteria bacterium]|nr:RNA polymerase sigma factor [Candidatus Parcubacteria bacterium]